MEPTTILSNEHRVIEIVLAALENLANRTLAEKKLDRKSAQEAIDFIKNFADRCHHGKEEDYLFAALVNKGIPKEAGPVGQMLREHEQGRAFVIGMADNLAGAESGETQAIRGFVNNALGYVELLKAHIHKEDHILFPMASRLLSGEDKTQLLRKFESVESEHMGQGTHEKYIEIAKNLAERFDIPHQDIVNISCGCGHKGV